MKKYKDSNNEIYAFEDNINIDKYIKELSLVSITKEEAQAIHKQKDIEYNLNHKKEIELAKAKQFILDFDYVENKIVREQQLHGIDILDTKSDKIDMTYREILLHKEECISNSINNQ